MRGGGSGGGGEVGGRRGVEERGESLWVDEDRGQPWVQKALRQHFGLVWAIPAAQLDRDCVPSPHIQ